MQCSHCLRLGSINAGLNVTDPLRVWLTPPLVGSKEKRGFAGCLGLLLHHRGSAPDELAINGDVKRLIAAFRGLEAFIGDGQAVGFEMLAKILLDTDSGRRG